MGGGARSAGPSHKPTGTRVLVLVRDLDFRFLTEAGELIRALALDPSREYQPMGQS